MRRILGYMRELKRKGAPIVSKDGAINQVLNWPYGVKDILIEDEIKPEQIRELDRLGIPKCLWGHLAVFFNTDEKLYLCPRAYDREGYSVEIGDRPLAEAFQELVAKRKCYMCGQMGDLSYSFNFGLDNLKTWFKF